MTRISSTIYKIIGSDNNPLLPEFSIYEMHNWEMFEKWPVCQIIDEGRNIIKGWEASAAAGGIDEVVDDVEHEDKEAK